MGRYLRQVAARTERLEAAQALLRNLRPPLPADDLTGLLDLLIEFRDSDPLAPTSPWWTWTTRERRDFLGLFISRLEIAPATIHGGEHWKGHDRLRITWAGEAAEEDF